MNNDQILRNRARVLDEDLAGRASTAGADALLAEIVLLEQVPTRRRRMPSPRRVLLGVAATAALTGVLVVGPSLFGASEQVYASQAVTIDREGDRYAFYITDGDPDPSELEKAFRKVGLENITVKLIPVSPRQRSPVVGVDLGKAGSGARASVTVSDCAERVEGCLTAFRITADLQGPAQLRLGRPAKPGEKYAYPADASWPGEALAGVTLQGRSAGEATRVVREHDLKVAYELDWPLRSGERGFQSEENVPASRVDPSWAVASAETYNDGVITLHVVPGPDATPPPGF
ncbi:hypothetical protein [Streptosporangium sp. 'caverna']|uniref:hypothetical protein n=1 Tax=Streptosporangium sp. 'caverna' TaxID=2202249 RepID=UPI000D7E1AF1|nr:hypothetical protein [Streptosporangium sp. 'caverna']AWS44715.1 hypothetical protein DKM19_28690 [Streptosporangium sp. 'caverna']